MINFPFNVHNTIGVEIPDPTWLTSQVNRLPLTMDPRTTPVLFSVVYELSNEASLLIGSILRMREPLAVELNAVQSNLLMITVKTIL